MWVTSERIVGYSENAAASPSGRAGILRMARDMAGARSDTYQIETKCN